VFRGPGQNRRGTAEEMAAFRAPRKAIHPGRITPKAEGKHTSKSGALRLTRGLVSRAGVPQRNRERFDQLSLGELANNRHFVGSATKRLFKRVAF
jgi:hypothetical protein